MRRTNSSDRNANQKPVRKKALSRIATSCLFLASRSSDRFPSIFAASVISQSQYSTTRFRVSIDRD
ncbi:hypothetical protein IB286_14460 [Spongiibacter sp. KMU-158]|uniref:Cyclin N-terminal domain-containing protein n=1 Tax=Spongiibacter pelagi TaxID=2760804 RepID=A0A927C600_9GAMM|nr:hypothetical protein [Spongiibacter pelagi]